MQLHAQWHVWICVAVAPLLLLRSDASVALGVKWFEEYLDRSFADVLQLPEGIFRSLRFLSSLATTLIASSLASYSCSSQLTLSENWVQVVLKGAIIGYIAAQIALAATVAIAAREVSAVAERRKPAILAAALLSIATAVGVILGSNNFTAAATASVAALLTAAPAVKVAPKVVVAAMSRIKTGKSTRVNGVSFARAIIATAPKAFIAFAPGFFLGGLARSIGTRLAATVRHPWLGIKASGENWWRTLFVTDICYPPEVIPGYARNDPFTFSYLYDRLKNSDSPTRRYFYTMALIVLYAPAIFYRMVIKSTFWFSFALGYVARPPYLANHPE
jgi:hypothetical protein